MKKSALIVGLLLILTLTWTNLFACSIWEAKEGEQHDRTYWSKNIMTDKTGDIIEKIKGVQLAHVDRYQVFVRKSKCFKWDSIHREICEIIDRGFGSMANDLFDDKPDDKAQGNTASYGVFEHSDITITGDAVECVFSNCTIYIGEDAKRLNIKKPK